MSDDPTPQPLTVVHGTASHVEVAAVHAAITRSVGPTSGPLADLARWRRRRLAALAEQPTTCP